MVKPGLLYRFLKWYVPIGLHVFYRKLQVSGLEHVPLKGPVIFAVNHQNAFMDALVVASTTARNPWFITRASVFRSATARYWLNKLQMLPIYRFRDGHAEMKKNDQAFARLKNLLHQEQAVLVFPEGNHNRQWKLRPLQKGIARIAFDFESEAEFLAPLKIVPVGLQYENHLHSGSDLLVSYGQAVEVIDYQKEYKSNPAKAMHALMEELAKRMQSIIVHIESQEKYDAIYKSVTQRNTLENDLKERLKKDQKYVEELLERDSIIEPDQRMIPNTCVLYKWIYSLLIIPHLLSLWVVRLMIKKTVRDDHWTSSIKIAGMLFIAPLLYLLQACLLAVAGISWVGLLFYFLLLPISGRLIILFRARCRKHILT